MALQRRTPAGIRAYYSGMRAAVRWFCRGEGMDEKLALCHELERVALDPREPCAACERMFLPGTGLILLDEDHRRDGHPAARKLCPECFEKREKR